MIAFFFMLVAVASFAVCGEPSEPNGQEEPSGHNEPSWLANRHNDPDGHNEPYRAANGQNNPRAGGFRAE